MSKRGKIILGLVSLMIIVVITFFALNRYYGWIKLGAEAIIGCQNSSNISAMLGKPGTNLTTYNLFGSDVTVNEMVVPFYDAIQQEVRDAKTGYDFGTVQTYNYRSKRGGGGLSMHSWGIAVDINPGSNPAGSTDTDIPRPIIDIFNKYGFFWGGNWEGRVADPMHFEWYGAKISGSFVNINDGAKITDATATIDGNGAAITNGDYEWILAGTHPYQIKAKARGFEDNNFELSLGCFEQRVMDISLKPLPDNLPGSISGTVRLTGDRAVLVPATIYLDGKIVGASNVSGDYIIPNVMRGKHKVEARVLFFPGASIETPDMVPGEAITNLNFTIGG